jgi:hypothetical protein
MPMRTIALFLLPLLLLPACSPTEEPDAPEEEAAVPDAPPSPAEFQGEADEELVGMEKKQYTVGDVEQTVFVNMTVAQESLAPNVGPNRLEDKQDRIKFLEISVAPPYPESLWLKPVLQSKNDFSTTQAVIRIDIVREQDGEVLAEFDRVLHARGTHRKEYELEPVDVMQGLENPPEVMVVKVDTEAVLVYEDLAVDEIDPTTYTGERLHTTDFDFGTVARIEFLGQEDVEVAPPAIPAPGPDTEPPTEPKQETAPSPEAASDDEAAAPPEAEEGAADAADAPAEGEAAGAEE